MNFDFFAFGNGVESYNYRDFLFFWFGAGGGRIKGEGTVERIGGMREKGRQGVEGNSSGKACRVFFFWLV